MPTDDATPIRYPHSRLKGMKDFMGFVQEPGWKPHLVNVDLLKKLDMARGKEGEAVATLVFLGVIDKNGVPTSIFDDLKQSYQATMKHVVKAKYADVFDLIPANKINQARLVRFFGPTVETAEYRAKLFVWLCEQGGIDLPNCEKKFHRGHNDKQEGDGIE